MKHSTSTRIDWGTVRQRLFAVQRTFEHSSITDETAKQMIFRSRAERLAAKAASEQEKAATCSALVFQLGAERYGIVLHGVAQVVPSTRITAVPGAPAHILGVANLHGEVRSVVGLRRLLKLTSSDGNDAEADGYIVLLRKDQRRVGLQVERIDCIQQLVLDEAGERAFCSDENRSPYVKCVTANNVIVLNTDRLF